MQQNFNTTGIVSSEFLIVEYEYDVNNSYYNKLNMIR